MNCTICGNEQKDMNELFCSRCGTKFEQRYQEADRSDAKDKAKAHNRREIFTMVLLNILIVGLVFVGTSIYFSNLPIEQLGNRTPGGELTANTGGTAFVALIFDTFILWGSLSSKCPSCKAFGGRVVDHKKQVELSRKEGYRTRSETSDIKAQDGTVIGTTKINRQVRVQTITYQNHFHCRYCGYQWIGEKKEEHENFDQ
jgi:hypothetical protein